MTQVREQAHGVELSDAMKAFLDEVKPAVVGTTRRDGSVQMNPIWYDRVGNQIRLNPTVSRMWGKRLEPGREVTLFFIDPTNMWRWAEVRGRVVAKTLEGGAEHIDLLSQRYKGQLYDDHDPNDPRQVVTVDPVRVFGTIDEPWG